MIGLQFEPFTNGPCPVVEGKVHLEGHTDCWMCGSFNTAVAGKLLNRPKSGFKCVNCGKHSHARKHGLRQNVCDACVDGTYLYMPGKDRN